LVLPLGIEGYIANRWDCWDDVVTDAGGKVLEG